MVKLQIEKILHDKKKTKTAFADMLGIKKQNTAAIGDYFNDVDMLKAVTHPAACGQAPDEIKALAEYVACHCNKGAVADFINYLEKNYIR